MKYLYILLLLILCLNVQESNSQEWFDESTEWLYAIQEWGPERLVEKFSYNRAELVNGLEYLVFDKRTYEFFGQTNSDGSFSHLTFIDSTMVEDFSYFRASGDSFINYSPTQNAERLLFVFDAPVGSHWNSLFSDFSSLELCHDCETAGVNETQVTSSGTSVLDGQEIDHVSVSCVGYVDKIYSDVGPSDYLMPYWGCISPEAIFDPFEDRSLLAFRNSSTIIELDGHNFDFPFGQSILTGINDELDRTITVSPNPFDESLKVELAGYPEFSRIELFDWKGNLAFEKEIFNLDLNHGVELLTDKIASGIYLLVIRNENESLVRKVLKH